MNAYPGRLEPRSASRWRRRLRQAHAWVGLVASLLIAAMALSGTVLLFKDDLRRLSVAGAAAPAPKDPARLGAIVNEAARRFGSELRTVRFGSTDFGLAEAILEDGGAYLDGDGRMVAQWSGRRTLDWLVEFHHHLFLGKTGATIIGTVGLVAFAMLVSGLWLWWPTRGSFRLRPRLRNRRAALLANHRDLGALLAPLLVVSILTGTAMGLSDVSQTLFGFRRQTPDVGRGHGASIDWREAIPAAVARLPDAVPRQVQLATGNRAATIRLRRPGEWNRQGLSMVYLSPGGTILGVVDAEAERIGARLYARLFPVHSGQVGQLILKLLLLAGGLGLTLVALLGGEAFRRRLRGRGGHGRSSAA